MNLDETKALVDLVKELRPYQQWTDHTVDAWNLVLGDPDDPISGADAMAAVKRLAKTEKFIGTSEIYLEAQKIAGEAFDYAIIPAPDADPDDPIAYITALRRTIRELGATPPPLPTLDPDAYAAAMRRQRQMIGGAGSMPREIEAAAPSSANQVDAWLEMRAEMDDHDMEFMRRRAAANAFECTQPGCEAPVDRSCSMDGKPLTVQPAHWQRLVAAGLEKPLPPPISADKFKAMIDAGLIA